MLKKLIVATAVIAGSATGIGAQTQVTTTIPDATRQQVAAFEAALKTGVEKATGSLGDRAREVVPDIVMRYQVGLEVQSYVLPTDGSYLFVVDPPIIESTVLLLFEVNQRFPRPTGPVRNVGSTSGPEAPIITNLSGEYAGFVHSAIVSTMLDNALALPITESQTLIVIVSTGAAPQTNPMAPRDRKLHLTLKGADLIALRQNGITREQARARIVEMRY